MYFSISLGYEREGESYKFRSVRETLLQITVMYKLGFDKNAYTYGT